MPPSADQIRRLFRSLKAKFDPHDRVRLILSSDEPDWGPFFDFMKSQGTTHMEPSGEIFVKIHDAAGATLATVLEECAHARQYMSDGNVDLTADNPERTKREREVAECLLGDYRAKLTVDDIEHYEEHLRAYDEAEK